MKCEIGIPIPQSSPEALDIDRLKTYLKSAEKLNYDSLWVTEQLFGPGPRLDALDLLIFAAAQISRPRLGTAILLLSLRNPVFLAKSLTTLDHLSGGRLTLGIGLGGNPAVFPALGISFDERLKRFNHGLRVLKKIWTESNISDQSDFWQIEDFPMEPKPLQNPHPPILFGGSVRNALKRAVNNGDGWMAPGAASTTRYLEELATLHEVLDEEDRDPATFETGKRVYIAIDDDADRARDRLRQWFGKTYAPRSAEGVDEVAIFGPAQDCLSQLEPILKSNPDRLILNPVFDELEQIEHMASEFVPAIRNY